MLRTRLLLPPRILSRRLVYSQPNPFLQRHHPLRPLLRPRRILLYTSLSILSLSLISLHPSLQGLIYADSPLTVSLKPGEEYFDTSLRSLVRSYLVFTLCSFPKLVDASPWFMELAKVPLVGAVVRGMVRVTFFDHFVGGDTVEQTVPLISTLRHAKKGTLLAYSVEVDQSDATSGSSSSPSPSSSPTSPSSPTTTALAPHEQSIQEMLHSIDVAANFEDALHSSHSSTSLTSPSSTSPTTTSSTGNGRRTWVAVKLSALVPDPTSFVRLSAYLVQRAQGSSSSEGVPFPGVPSSQDLPLLSSPTSPTSSLTSTSSGPGPLTNEDVNDFKKLYTSLRKLCKKAKERNVKIIIDAEYTWYQPGIDLFVRGLSGEFNRLDSAGGSGWVGGGEKGGKGKEGGGEGGEGVLVYGTYQAYLRRTPAQLRASLADAKKHGYALGVKLVRGAYHPYEVAAWNAVYGPSSPSSSSTGEKDEETKALAKVSLSPDRNAPPVWEKKEDTDRCYNECVSLLVDAVHADISASASTSSTAFKPWKWIPWRSTSSSSAAAKDLTPEKQRPSSPTVGVLFGTHNWQSCRHLVRELGRVGLAEVVYGPTSSSSSSSSADGHEGDEGKMGREEREEREEIGDDTVVKVPTSVVERIAVGQLFGMSDDLTNYMVKRVRTEDGTPFVVKYVPYGPLAEAMPYLSRRAIENKSVLGGGAAKLERERAGREIWKRVFG